MVLFEALPPAVQEDLLSRLSVADLGWAEQWRSAASYADAAVQSADEGTTRHLGLITTDVADYTTRLATGYAVGGGGLRRGGDRCRRSGRRDDPRVIPPGRQSRGPYTGNWSTPRSE